MVTFDVSEAEKLQVIAKRLWTEIFSLRAGTCVHQFYPMH